MHEFKMFRDVESLWIWFMIGKININELFEWKRPKYDSNTTPKELCEYLNFSCDFGIELCLFIISSYILQHLANTFYQIRLNQVIVLHRPLVL